MSKTPTLLRWANFLHLYQPPMQDPALVKIVVRESYRPLVKLLAAQPHYKVTINGAGSLLDLLKKHSHHDVITGLRQALQRGQIELVASAKYHPILPLIDAETARRQIAAHDTANRAAFGSNYHPQGLYLPEMAYSTSVAKLVKKLGYRWLILDPVQTLTTVDSAHRYRDRASGLTILFRDRTVSRSFPPETLLGILPTLHEPRTIITATDGEMYGHHHKDATDTLTQLLKKPAVTTTLLSPLAAALPDGGTITLRASSWETTPDDFARRVPYPLWKDPKNKVHTLLWRLATLAITLDRDYNHDGAHIWARKHLDMGLASCAWWWAAGRKPDIFTPTTWSPEEIEKGALNLIKSIRSFAQLPAERRLAAERLFTRLHTAAWDRHWRVYHHS